MECNRGEAARAKEIGERKLAEKDIAGAKKLALKAQSLYPGLEGLPQFLAILEVYLSSEKIINGVHDYYGILCVEPLADEDTIRKHYRKLALLLHPDKNKSVGADGAFKIISEAWSMLSDPSKKNLYDQKRNLRTFFQNVSMANPSVLARNNGYSNSTCSKATQKGVCTKKDAAKPNELCQQSVANGEGPQSATNGVRKQSVARPNASPAKVSEKISFWTVCTHCKMQYEYHRKYFSHILLCHNCQKPFCAVEMPPPQTGCMPWKSNQQGQISAKSSLNVPPKKPLASPNLRPSGVPGVDSSNANFQSSVFSKTVGSKGRQTTSVPQQLKLQAHFNNQMNNGTKSKKRRMLLT